MTYVHSLYFSDGSLDLFMIVYALFFIFVASKVRGAAREFLKKYNWWINILGMASVAYVFSGRYDVAFAWSLVGALAGFTSSLVWAVSDREIDDEEGRKLWREKFFNETEKDTSTAKPEKSESIHYFRPELIPKPQNESLREPAAVESTSKDAGSKSLWLAEAGGVMNLDSCEFIPGEFLYRIYNNEWKGLNVKGSSSSVIWIPDEQLIFLSEDPKDYPWLNGKKVADDV